MADVQETGTASGASEKRKKYPCKHCNLDYVMSSDYRVHMLNIHGVKIYKCETCSELFDSEPALVEHVNSIHEGMKRHFCNICPRSYKDPKQLLVHIEHKHKIEDAITCKKCGQEFYNRIALKLHLSLHHKPHHIYHKCRKCSRSFKHKKLLQQHQEFDHAHNGKKNTLDFLKKLDIKKGLTDDGKTCKLCKIKFKASIDLVQHVRLDHRKPKTFPCCQCKEAVYFSRASLGIHMRHEHGLLNHSCNMCPPSQVPCKTRPLKPKKVKKVDDLNSKNACKRQRKNDSLMLFFNRKAPQIQLNDTIVNTAPWASKFIKENIPADLDLKNVNDHELFNLRHNIKTVFHILSTVAPSRLKKSVISESKGTVKNVLGKNVSLLSMMFPNLKSSPASAAVSTLSASNEVHNNKIISPLKASDKTNVTSNITNMCILGKPTEVDNVNIADNTNQILSNNFCADISSNTSSSVTQKLDKTPENICKEMNSQVTKKGDDSQNRKINKRKRKHDEKTKNNTTESYHKFINAKTNAPAKETNISARSAITEDVNWHNVHKIKVKDFGKESEESIELIEQFIKQGMQKLPEHSKEKLSSKTKNSDVNVSIIKTPKLHSQNRIKVSKNIFPPESACNANAQNYNENETLNDLSINNEEPNTLINNVEGNNNYTQTVKQTKQYAKNNNGKKSRFEKKLEDNNIFDEVTKYTSSTPIIKPSYSETTQPKISEVNVIDQTEPSNESNISNSKDNHKNQVSEDLKASNKISSNLLKAGKETHDNLITTETTSQVHKCDLSHISTEVTLPSVPKTSPNSTKFTKINKTLNIALEKKKSEVKNFVNVKESKNKQQNRTELETAKYSRKNYEQNRKCENKLGDISKISNERATYTKSTPVIKHSTNDTTVPLEIAEASTILKNKHFNEKDKNPGIDAQKKPIGKDSLPSKKMSTKSCKTGKQRHRNSTISSESSKLHDVNLPTMVTGVNLSPLTKNSPENKNKALNIDFEKKNKRSDKLKEDINTSASKTKKPQTVLKTPQFEIKNYEQNSKCDSKSSDNTNISVDSNSMSSPIIKQINKETLPLETSEVNDTAKLTNLSENRVFNPEDLQKNQETVDVLISSNFHKARQQKDATTDATTTDALPQKQKYDTLKISTVPSFTKNNLNAINTIPNINSKEKCSNEKKNITNKAESKIIKQTSQYTKENDQKIKYVSKSKDTTNDLATYSTPPPSMIEETVPLEMSEVNVISEFQPLKKTNILKPDDNVQKNRVIKDISSDKTPSKLLKFGKLRDNNAFTENLNKNNFSTVSTEVPSIPTMGNSLDSTKLTKNNESLSIHMRIKCSEINLLPSNENKMGNFESNKPKFEKPIHNTSDNTLNNIVPSSPTEKIGKSSSTLSRRSPRLNLAEQLSLHPSSRPKNELNSSSNTNSSDSLTRTSDSTAKNITPVGTVNNMPESTSAEIFFSSLKLSSTSKRVSGTLKVQSNKVKTNVENTSENTSIDAITNDSVHSENRKLVESRRPMRHELCKKKTNLRQKSPLEIVSTKSKKLETQEALELKGKNSEQTDNSQPKEICKIPEDSLLTTNTEKETIMDKTHVFQTPTEAISKQVIKESTTAIATQSKSDSLNKESKHEVSIAGVSKFLEFKNKVPYAIQRRNINNPRYKIITKPNILPKNNQSLINQLHFKEQCSPSKETVGEINNVNSQNATITKKEGETGTIGAILSQKDVNSTLPSSVLAYNIKNKVVVFPNSQKYLTSDSTPLMEKSLNSPTAMLNSKTLKIAIPNKSLNASTKPNISSNVEISSMKTIKISPLKKIVPLISFKKFKIQSNETKVISIKNATEKTQSVHLNDSSTANSDIELTIPTFVVTSQEVNKNEENTNESVNLELNQTDNGNFNHTDPKNNNDNDIKFSIENDKLKDKEIPTQLNASEEAYKLQVDDNFCVVEKNNEEIQYDDINIDVANYVDIETTDSPNQSRNGSPVKSKLKYNCVFCQLSFVDEISLLNHLTEVHAEDESLVTTLYKCHTCGEGFRFKENLESHIESEHTEDKNILCSKCSVTFINRNEFYMHDCLKSKNNLQKEEREMTKSNTELKLARGNFKNTIEAKKNKLLPIEGEHNNDLKKRKELTCDICNLQFKNSVLLSRHIKMKHNEKHMFTCNTCGLQFSKNGFKRHKCKSKQQLFCRRCLITFPDVESILQHKRKEHNLGSLKCYYCCKYFKTKKNLMKHVTCKHYTHMEPKKGNIIPINPKDKNCKKQQKNTIYDDLKIINDSSQSQSHYKNSINELKDVNKKVSTSKHRPERSEKRHIIMKEKNIHQEKCDQCNEKFKSRHELEKHSLIHRHLYYKCLKCYKKFSQKNLLSKHIRIIHKVETQKLHRCNECTAVFKFEDKLNQHLKLKHRKSERETEYADNTLTSQSQKISNVSTFEVESNPQKEEMFKCKECGALLPSNASLQRHMQWEHMKTHKCGICGEILPTAEEFLRHLTSGHANEKIKEVLPENSFKWKTHLAHKHERQAE